MRRFMKEPYANMVNDSKRDLERKEVNIDVCRDSESNYSCCRASNN
jgi:hypothetical protein